jgi:hypothetical protein
MFDFSCLRFLAKTNDCRPKKKTLRQLFRMEMQGEIDAELLPWLWPRPTSASIAKAKNGEDCWAVQKEEEDTHAVLCQNVQAQTTTLRVVEGLDLLTRETPIHPFPILTSQVRHLWSWSRSFTLMCADLGRGS